MNLKQDRIKEIVQRICLRFADVFNKAFENYKK
jgi:ribosomal protein S17E